MTEVGWIPKDWEVKTIGEVAQITTGSQNTQDHSVFGKYPFYVRSQQVEKIDNYIFDTEGIVTAGDGVGTGKVFHYVKGKFGLHQRCYLIFNFDEHVHGKYLFWIFSQNFYNRINQMTAKSSVDSVRKEMISGMLIPFPSPSEQRRIASVLSDTDSLIASLSRTIEKKRLVKQGAMQQLLTGKTRLKGFSDEWVEKELGEVCKIQRGSILKSSDYCYGTIPVIAGGMTPAGYHNVANREGRTITISASGANAGYVSIHNGKIFASDCSTISESNEYNIDFIYQFLLLNQTEIYRAQTGGAQPHIHPKDVAPMKIKMPDYNEQFAISERLRTMDNEIASLEAELQKYKALKQGMMQTLLTGQIRLK